MTKRRYHNPSILSTSLLVFALPFLIACGGTFEVGLEHTITPGQTATVAPSDTATPSPTITPPPSQPAVSSPSTPLPDPSSYLMIEREGGVLGNVWTLADVRYGVHPDRVQIVLEIVEHSEHVPAFRVIEVDNAASPFPTGHDLSWGQARIDLIVSDLYAHNSPVVEQLPLILPDNPLVTRIGLYPTYSDSHMGFSVGLKEPVAYKIYELTDPTRIVIAVLYPTDIMDAPVPTPTSTPTVPTATAMPITPTPIPRPSPTPGTSAMTLTFTCTYPWFFPNPPAECAGQPPIYSLTVTQHFEYGLMLWRERPDFYGSQIYAFFTDNQWPYWNPTNDTWRSGMPESDPTIVPPPGYHQPVRGFGAFWREAFFGMIGLSARDRLGWATDEEFSIGELPMQCHSNDNHLPSCYLAGPDKAVYVIRPDNNWFVWEGPTTVPAPSISTPCASEELAKTVWPQLYQVQLAETTSGPGIKVMGSGGYAYWDSKCGQRYDESARSFQLYFDGAPVDSIICYVNHCEATLDMPADVLLGTHTISVEGGSSITVQVASE